MQAHLHFFVDCVVELFKQSKIESNLDRNSAVPMALDERTPTLNVAQNRNVAGRKGSGQQSGESGTFFHYNLYFLYSY